MKTVVVLGASDNKDRYSNRAINLLAENGYSVIGVHPTLENIDGFPVVKNLADVKTPVYTITVYVNPTLLEKLTADIINLKPQRVILNPGTESSIVENELIKNNIPVQKSCTLVLLNTGQFEKNFNPSV